MEKVTLGTKTVLGRDHVLNDMCEAIRHASDKYKSSGQLLGVGIGVPGIIDLQTGMVRESPNLPGWSDYPVRNEIEKRLGAPVILENDANVAAFGEKWLGAGRHVGDMAMLTLGTGVGGGLVLNGKIWHGMTGMAGEFGHMTVDPDGQLCGCGNHGCLEQYASATAIVRMARELITTGDAPGLAKAAGADLEFNAKEIYNQAIQGDEQAKRIFRRVGRALGIALVGDGEWFESRDVRHWRRCVQRVGGLLANHLRGIAPARDGVCGDGASRSSACAIGRIGPG